MKNQEKSENKFSEALEQTMSLISQNSPSYNKKMINNFDNQIRTNQKELFEKLRIRPKKENFVMSRTTNNVSPVLSDTSPVKMANFSEPPRTTMN